jgi:phosphate butyryltransferase
VPKVAVAAAEDKHVLLALKSAWIKKIAMPVLIGNKDAIEEIADSINFDLDGLEVINEKSPEKSCKIAVEWVSNKNAGILMKGLVSTAALLRAVLNKENGLKRKTTLSHFALFEIPTYHKLLGITDAAMNIAPDLNEKISIINNAVGAARGVGINSPKVAIVCPVEVVNPKIESTVHASIMTTMNRRGQIKNCMIDGPLALDIAISKKAALHKGIENEVAGDADILMTPDLNSGNILYKSLAFLGGGKSAAIITGSSAPIVLTSRSDTEETKLYSIALAASIISNNNNK